MTEIDKKIAETKELLESLQEQKRSHENDLRVLEFFKRGYTAGTVVKCRSSHYSTPSTLKNKKLRIVNTNQIWCDGVIIFDGFRWAEIIEQPALEFEKFKVEARGGKAFINGNFYSIEELEMLSGFMKSHANQVKFISCGCNSDTLINVPVDVIDDILNLVKTQVILEESRKKHAIPKNLIVIKHKISNDSWWYNYRKEEVFSVEQANQSDLTDIELVEGASRDAENYWKVVSDEYKGYVIAKTDCRTLNISEK